MTENEEELKSSSSIESNETFEEKMAHIQQILAGQKAEIEGRRENRENDENAEEARTLGDLANSETKNEFPTSEESDFKWTESANAKSEKLAENVAESLTEEVVTEPNLWLSSTSTESNPITLEESIEKPSEDAALGESVTPVESKVTESSDKALEKKKSKKAPTVVGIAAIALIGTGIYSLVNKPNKNEDTSKSSVLKSSSSSSSSTMESSKKKEGSSSSSTTESSSSVVSSSSSTEVDSPAAPQSRADLIASLGASPRVPLDPNITGSEAAFNWPDGLQQHFVDMMVSQGKISPTGYQLIPAQIAGGQGWVNLYNSDKQWVAAINLTTGLVLD
ncbi:MAG: hypothetical protein LBI13_08940 [Streptococcaceae bacterium]|jgi:hypothetical protein|nr:hypothetical protein [Streptococcaceae bacterium]